MKSARSLEPCDPAESRLRDYDLREIDAEDQRSHFALKYLDRLEAVRAAVRRHVTAPGLVAEIGCAQANLGLLLAEEGYAVVALDLMPQAVSYARRKHESCSRVPAMPWSLASFLSIARSPRRCWQRSASASSPAAQLS